MNVFIAHSSRDRDLVASLVTLLHEDGHDVFDPTGVTAAGNVLSEISAAIRSADVLVAVVTAGNPNVFYELGLAAGASVPILITAPAGELLPADLASVPYVQLTGDTLRDAQTIARRANELRSLAPTEPTKFESAEAALRAAIREPAVLESLSPSDFERLVMDLFKERGYAVTAARSTQETGVDFAIESQKDRELVLVEVKKLSGQSRVSVETVRKLLSAVSAVGTSLGMLVATSGYTAAALAFAAGTPILLRTLEEILAARSEKDLLQSEPKEGFHGVATMQNRKPTVFISYKREDAIHDGWVERFATDLRGAGIDAVLDIWEVRLGESFTDYMALKINEADAVLFIITTASVAAVESPHHGALKFELQMANARLIAGEPFRLIGIYREGHKPPIHLRDNRYADFRDDSKYAETLTALVADLVGKTGPPPLTTRVSLLHRDLGEIEALLPRYPNHASLMSAYLNVVEKEGTREQITLALERARVWMVEHPDDTYVGRFYIGLVERRGTTDQVAEMLNHFGSWLRTPEHADNASIRSGFLGVVGRSTVVTDEQVSTIIEDTRDWLKHRPNDLHGRGAYLSLASRRGTDRQFEDALSDITAWLADPKHSDDTHVRLTYLGVVGRRGNDSQRMRALEDTELWLAAHQEDIAVRQAYRALKIGSRGKRSREKRQ